MPLVDIGREGSADVLSLLVGAPDQFVAYDIENTDVTEAVDPAGTLIPVAASNFVSEFSGATSNFSVDSVGVITYNPAATPNRRIIVTGLVRVTPQAGNNQNLEITVLHNGSEVVGAGSDTIVGFPSQGVMLPLYWLMQIEPGDTLQLALVNFSSTVNNVIVDKIRFALEGT